MKTCFLLLFLFSGWVLAQQPTDSLPTRPQKEPGIRSIGLRFASDFNYFRSARDLDLVDGWFSTGVFGVFYQYYTPSRGVEIGLNINYKPVEGGLPVVMRDYAEQGVLQSVGMTAIETDLKVGPRFDWFQPKIGYILGYRIARNGFLEPGSEREINAFYLQLPLGASVAFPTNFGAVGAGIFFELDILNVQRNDGSVMRPSVYNGGRQHAVNFEINVTYEP